MGAGAGLLASVLQMFQHWPFRLESGWKVGQVGRLYDLREPERNEY
jgi:hypothetical protein